MYVVKSSQVSVLHNFIKRVLKLYCKNFSYIYVINFIMETSESDIIAADSTTHIENEREENEASTDTPVQETEKPEKLFKLPLSRIKHIMKMDPDTKHSTQEAAFLITKATELFLGSLATEAYKQAAQAKRKTIQRKDIDSAINCIDSLAFLEGALE